MRLRYLFDNRDLAVMLLGDWEYDASSLDLFRYYRISSNAVYPFRVDGEVRMLRFSPVSEKVPGGLEAELDFLSYLRGCGYPAAEAVPTREGERHVRRDTPWGMYEACVFRKVPGIQLSEAPLARQPLVAYGAALGRLHELSRGYRPLAARRWSHLDVLVWIEEVLRDIGGGARALREAELLREAFGGLPAGSDDYGLVHYDFELDNVFFDAGTGAMHAIDFDDAMYHWYAMDIAQALDSMEADGELAGIGLAEAREAFLDGYRGQSPIEDGMLAALPLFTRFASLYGYARIARSVQERWANEPEWLVGLRGRLAAALESRAAHFGQAMEC